MVAANNTLADRTGELVFTVTSDTETRIVKVTFTQEATDLISSPYAFAYSTQAEVGGSSATGDINGLGLEGVDITDLSSLTGITSLTGDDGDLVIKNTGLTSLAGLNNITSISGDLIIQDNNNLTSLEGLNALTNVGGHVVIRDNGALFSLVGLDVLGTITGDVTIQDNGMLSLCCGSVPLATAIEDVRDRTTPQRLSTAIFGNGSDNCGIGNIIRFLNGVCPPAPDLYIKNSDEVEIPANNVEAIEIQVSDNTVEDMDGNPEGLVDATGWVATIAYMPEGADFIDFTPEMGGSFVDDIIFEDGYFVITATPNSMNTGVERTAIITITTTGSSDPSSVTFTITQRGAAPVLTFAPVNDTIAYDAETANDIMFNVGGGATGWTSSIVYTPALAPGASGFITLTPADNAERGDVTVGVVSTVNTGVERSAEIAITTVGGTGEATDTVTITQGGAPHTLSLAPDTITLLHGEATTSEGITVTLGGGAAGWSAESSDTDFITVPDNGSGGTIALTLAGANVGVLREAIITVTTTGDGTKTSEMVIVRQGGAPHMLTLAPDTITLLHGATTSEGIAVTLGGGASGWSAESSDTDFITVPDEGTGGTIALTLAGGANMGVLREAVITVTTTGDGTTTFEMVIVRQGGAPHTLDLTSAPTVTLAHSATTTGDIEFTLGGGAAGWSAESDNTGFITVPDEGTGGTIAVTVVGVANTGSEREAVITVTTTGDGTTRSEMVTITQQEVPTIALGTSATVDIGYDVTDAQTITFDVGGSATGWDSDTVYSPVGTGFITLTPTMNDSETGTVTVEAKPTENTGAAREVTITFYTTGQLGDSVTAEVTIEQGAAPGSPTLGLTSHTSGDTVKIAHSDGAATMTAIAFTVGGNAMGWTSAIAYTPVGADFIGLDMASNVAETGAVTVTATPTGVNSGIERSATITLSTAGHAGTPATATLTITQGGAPHTLSLAPDTITLLHGEATTLEEITVTLGGGASGWSAESSDTDFITVPDNGSGGTIALTLAGANVGVLREAIITVTTTGDGTKTSEMVIVRQGGAPHMLTLAPDTITLLHGATTSEGITVTLGGGASGWSAESSDTDFITVPDEETGGTIALTLAGGANMGVLREAIITVTTTGDGTTTSEMVTVTQGGAPHTLDITSAPTVTLAHSATTTGDIEFTLGGGAAGWSAESDNTGFITVPDEGTGGTIAVTVVGVANTGSAREAVITVTTTGDGTTRSEMVTITQQQVPTIALSTSATVDIDYNVTDVQTITFDVGGSATGWDSDTVYNPVGTGFITLTPTMNDSETGTVTVEAKPTENTGAAREVTITFYTTGQLGDSVTAEVTIEQGGAPNSPTLGLTSHTSGDTVKILHSDGASTMTAIAFTVGGNATGWTSNIVYTPVGANFIGLDMANNIAETGAVTVTATPTDVNSGIERSATITLSTTGPAGTPATATLTITQGGAPHTLSLDPSTVPLLHDATTISDEITVTLGGGASGWSATSSNESFITVPDEGTGGTIALTLAGGANMGVLREAIITVTTTGDGTTTSEMVTVTQGGAPHTLSLDPSTVPLLHDATTISGEITVTLGGGASGWSAESDNTGFITVPGEGTGGTIALTLAGGANMGVLREAIITVTTTGDGTTTSEMVTVTQGGAPHTLDLTSAPTVTLAHSATTTGDIEFTLGGGAAGWSATSDNTGFITVPDEGTGGTIAVTVVGVANTGSAREAVITVTTTGDGTTRSEMVTITQQQVPTIALSTSATVDIDYNVTAAQTITFDVGGSATGWDSDTVYNPVGTGFITLTPTMNDSETGTVTVEAKPTENTGAAREVTITFYTTGQLGDSVTAEVTIEQGAAPGSPTLGLTSHTSGDTVKILHSDGAATMTAIDFMVGGNATGWTSAIAYTPVGADFIGLDMANNVAETGAVTVTATPTDVNSGIERSATITLSTTGHAGTPATATLTITQGGAPHTLSLDPSTVPLLHDATTTSEEITVTLGGGAAGWSATSSNESFITVPDNGTGGTIALTLAGGANMGVLREAIITVTTTGDGTTTSEMVTVTQGGAPHTLSLDPSTVPLLHDATTISDEITVMLGGGASGWSAESDDTGFITVPDEGTGGTIALTLAGGANMGVLREAIITVTTTGDGTTTSEMVTVTQGGAPHTLDLTSAPTVTLAHSATTTGDIEFTLGGGAAGWSATSDNTGFITVPDEGTGGTIAVTVVGVANTGSAREAVITVTTTGDGTTRSEMVTITQQQVPTIALSTSATVDIDYNVTAAQTITFDVGGSATGWDSDTVYSPVGTGFITLTPTMNDSETGTVTVEAKPTENTGAAREVTITFYTTGQLGDSVTAEVTIEQGAAPNSPTLGLTSHTSGDTVKIAHSDGAATMTDIDFMVGGNATGWTSNIVYTPVGANFIRLDMASNVAETGAVTVTATPTDVNSGIERSATITLSTTGPAGTPATATLTITQSAAPPIFTLTSDRAETIAHSAESATDITFNVGGGATGWTSSIAYTPDMSSGGEEFITLTPDNTGRGDVVMTVASRMNTTGVERSAVITITTRGGTGDAKGTTVTITQSAEPSVDTPTLVISTNDTTINHDATDAFEITFTLGGSAMGWQSTLAGDDFITLTPGEDARATAGEVTIMATASVNATGSERTQTITFTTVGGVTDMVIITQRAAPPAAAPTVSISTMDSTIEASATAAIDVVFTVGGSATGWGSTVTGDFITLDTAMNTDQTGEITIQATPTANMGVERVAKIVISTKGPGDAVSDTLTITQSAGPPIFTLTSDDAEAVAYDAETASDITFEVGGGATGWEATVIDGDSDNNFVTLSKTSGSAGLDTIKVTTG